MKEILLSACGAWVFVNMVQFHLLLRINRKPLNCECCMAGWFCLVLTYSNYYWIEIPFMMASSMMITAAFNFLMKKML